MMNGHVVETGQLLILEVLMQKCMTIFLNTSSV